MASLRRFPRSPYWFACFTLPDGRRTQQSTKSTDRKEAQRIANKFEDAAEDGRSGKLIEGQARKVIAEIFAIGNKDQLPSSTTQDFCKSWLKRKELEAGEKTHIRYRVTIEQFLKFLGNKATFEITQITRREIMEFRDSMAVRVSANTVNVNLKIIRAAFNQAKRDGLVDSNAAEQVTLLKRKRSSSRRPFTLEEMKTVLASADEEWRGMILVGIYTGLRLGDIAQLKWSNVELDTNEIRLVAGKTDRDMGIPMAKTLQSFFAEFRKNVEPDAPVFPRACRCYEESPNNGRLSKQFYQVLVDAGLAKKRKFKETGEGHSVKHTQSELSFHSLRHTATSLLKNAGVSDAVARDIIGHESVAVSRNYTHIDTATKRKAVDKMPDIFAD
jgi:integrase